MKQEYYLVYIRDIFDLDIKKSFLELIYPELFNLYKEKDNLLKKIITTKEEKKRIYKVCSAIYYFLETNHIPEYIICRSTERFYRVEEIFAKGELFLPSNILERSRVTRNSGLIGHWANEYTPEELIALEKAFTIFKEEKEKRKVLIFNNKKNNTIF